MRFPTGRANPVHVTHEDPCHGGMPPVCSADAPGIPPPCLKCGPSTQDSQKQNREPNSRAPANPPSTPPFAHPAWVQIPSEYLNNSVHLNILRSLPARSVRFPCSAHGFQVHLHIAHSCICFLQQVCNSSLCRCVRWHLLDSCRALERFDSPRGYDTAEVKEVEKRRCGNTLR